MPIPRPRAAFSSLAVTSSQQTKPGAELLFLLKAKEPFARESRRISKFGRINTFVFIFLMRLSFLNIKVMHGYYKNCRNLELKNPLPK